MGCPSATLILMLIFFNKRVTVSLTSGHGLVVWPQLNGAVGWGEAQSSKDTPVTLMLKVFASGSQLLVFSNISALIRFAQLISFSWKQPLNKRFTKSIHFSSSGENFLCLYQTQPCHQLTPPCNNQAHVLGDFLPSIRRWERLYRALTHTWNQF